MTFSTAVLSTFSTQQEIIHVRITGNTLCGKHTLLFTHRHNPTSQSRFAQRRWQVKDELMSKINASDICNLTFTTFEWRLENAAAGYLWKGLQSHSFLGSRKKGGLTLWRFRHGGVETVHVIASIAVIAEQKLILENKNTPVLCTNNLDPTLSQR